MLKWLKLLLDFALPFRCLLCGKVIKSENSLCPECFEKINFITAPYCKYCGSPLVGVNDDMPNLCCASCIRQKNNFRMQRAAIKYDENSKNLLLDFKFSEHIENKVLLARWLYWAGKDIFNGGVDLIIPVPLHFTRLLKRKYNQSAFLAAELSKLSGVPANYRILKKTKYTMPQVLCDGKKRKVNIRNAFKVTNPQKIKGLRIVLIDDVYTTGATTKECTKALKRAGAKSVDILTVAKVCPKK